MTAPPEVHGSAILTQLGAEKFNPQQIAQLISMGYSSAQLGGELVAPTPLHQLPPLDLIKSQSCTMAVTQRANGMKVKVVSSLGNPKDIGEVASEWKKYLDNPAGYTAADPRHGKIFAEAAEAMKDMLNKCFVPAASSPAYAALDIPRRLGIIEVEDNQQCEGLLISRDHILTARHCLFETTKAFSVAYQSGKALFKPSGSSKRYQICAAKTKLTEVSKSLADEPVVLRIAPVDYDLPMVELASPNEVIPFGGDQPPTNSVTFTWVDNASRFNSAYKGNLAIGSTPCFVMAYDKGNQCFTHMCMTYPGTSGGAMFTQQSGKWKLLAIHLGAAKPVDGFYPECTATATKLQNAGILVTDALVFKYSKEENK